MAHSFDIPIKGKITDTLAKAKEAIEEVSGTMTGDANAGSFNVPAGLSKVKGTYEVKDNLLKVSITNKPIYVSNSMIENLLREHIG